MQKRLAEYKLKIAKESHEADIRERQEQQRRHEEIHKAQLDFYKFLTESIKYKNEQ